MTESTRPEVYADPNGAALVLEHVDIVVATPDGPELSAGLLAKAVPVLGRDEVPTSVLEQLVVRRCGLVKIGEPDTEGE